MRLLFLTTFATPIDKEHYFTKGVYRTLKGKCPRNEVEIHLGTIYYGKGIEAHHEESYHNIHLSGTDGFSEQNQKALRMWIQNLAPDVIHSNMVEGFEINAAKDLGIPIFNTIHIGGVLCPRGGGNGFLDENDNICSRTIGELCKCCMVKDLPFPGVGRVLQAIIPGFIKKAIADSDRFFLYLSPLVGFENRIVGALRKKDLLNYSHLIVANRKLISILERNGITHNNIMLPHGVGQRQRLPNRIERPVKFYYLGRIQYSKGLHIVLDAFKDIDNQLYELHVFGDAETDGRSQAYETKIRRISRGLNIHFHGRIPNKELEAHLSNMNVMIHPAVYLEVYGLTIAEALSMGRPVIASRCGGPEEQIVDGVNGWLFDPKDVDKLRQIINDIIENPGIIDRMSSNATLPHSLEVYTDQLIHHYKNSLN